jgi:hypothetical protein
LAQWYRLLVVVVAMNGSGVFFPQGPVGDGKAFRAAHLFQWGAL